MTGNRHAQLPAAYVVRRGTDDRGVHWVEVECPYCGKRHNHGLGSDPSGPWPVSGDVRASHCVGRWRRRGKVDVFIRGPHGDYRITE